MFPYIACMSLVALSAGIMNTFRRFVVPAATPVLMNLSTIAVCWALAAPLERAGYPGIYAMAIGVMLGGVLQLVVQWPALRSIGMLPRLGWTWSGLRASRSHPGVGRLLLNMGPALLGVGVSQLSLMINTQISSHLAEGATTWLNYADRLMEFPTALLGVALGVVLIPQLSAAQARADAEAYSGLLDWGLRLVLLLALPGAVGLALLSVPLVSVLYHYGRYTAPDVFATQYAVLGYTVGLAALILVKVLAPGYFARQDTKTPVRVGLIALGVNMAMNVGVALPAVKFGFPYPHILIATSTCMSAAVNTTLLWRGLARAGVYKAQPGWGALLARILFANAVMAALLVWLGGDLAGWLELSPAHRAARLALCIVAGAAAYFGALFLSGTRLRHVRNLAGA